MTLFSPMFLAKIIPQMDYCAVLTMWPTFNLWKGLSSLEPCFARKTAPEYMPPLFNLLQAFANALLKRSITTRWLFSTAKNSLTRWKLVKALHPQETFAPH